MKYLTDQFVQVPDLPLVGKFEQLDAKRYRTHSASAATVSLATDSSPEPAYQSLRSSSSMIQRRIFSKRRA